MAIAPLSPVQGTSSSAEPVLPAAGAPLPLIPDADVPAPDAPALADVVAEPDAPPRSRFAVEPAPACALCAPALALVPTALPRAFDAVAVVPPVAALTAPASLTAAGLVFALAAALSLPASGALGDSPLELEAHAAHIAANTNSQGFEACGRPLFMFTIIGSPS